VSLNLASSLKSSLLTNFSMGYIKYVFQWRIMGHRETVTPDGG
jgi:hypothetical protein